MSSKLLSFPNGSPLFASVLLFLAIILNPTSGVAGDPSKAKAWAIGEKQSLAAVEYARGGERNVVNGMLADAEAIGYGLGIKIMPLPPQSADASSQMRDYLLKGDGSTVGKGLNQILGQTHAELYEIAVNANLLLLAD